MPNIRVEVDGRTLYVFVLRDRVGKLDDDKVSPPKQRRVRSRDRVPFRQRQMHREANLDVFDVVLKVDEMNRTRAPEDLNEPFRLIWEGDEDQFYETSKALRRALSGRCEVEVIQTSGMYGWQLTFRNTSAPPRTR